MLNLAWRNIWRKWGRSLFTVFAVGAAVFAITFQSAFLGGIRNSLYESLTQGVGHVQVRALDYRDARDFGDSLVRNAQEVQEVLQPALPDDAALVKTLQVPGLLEGVGRSRGIMLIGLDQPDAIREAFISDYLIAGDMPMHNEIDTIALGTRLADNLKVGLGDTVYMYAPGTEGYGAAAFTVIGLVNPPQSLQMAYASLVAVQDLAAPDAITNLEVHLTTAKRLADDARVPALKDSIQTALAGGYSVEMWREVDPNLSGFLDFIGPISLMFLLLFFVLAGLVVTNTVYLSIIERVREFGVMIALGMERSKVVQMVLFESLLLCATGALFGSALGVLFIWQSRGGVRLPGAEELGFPSVLYPSMPQERLIIIVVFVFLTGVFAALLPARTAGKLEPVEAMRFTA